MSKLFSVYEISNSVNAKVYIGKAADPRARWYGHRLQAKRGDTTPMHRAMRKHGIDRFTMRVLKTFGCESECFEFERSEIALRKACNRKYGYNISSGGDGPCGVIPSAETRRRMSEAGKRRVPRIISEDEKRRISAALKGRKNGPHSESRLAKMRASAAGRRLPAEAYRRSAETRTGRPLSDEHRAKLSDAKRGVPKSEETRARMSAAAKRRWAAGGAEAFGLSAHHERRAKIPE